MDVNYNTQSALSIPLSNIVDSGDGYIQYSNGTQICYGSFNSKISNLKYDQSTLESAAHRADVTFKKPFYMPPYLITDSSQSGIIWQDNINGNEHCTYRCSYTGSITRTGFSVTQQGPFGFISSLNQLHQLLVSGRYIAIGRWK